MLEVCFKKGIEKFYTKYTTVAAPRLRCTAVHELQEISRWLLHHITIQSSCV